MNLKPFLFRTSDGFLIGLAPEPEAGSPCAECIRLWLCDRNVFAERGAISELSIKKEILEILIQDNKPYLFYEIAKDGTTTRLECLVFSHPQCSCDKGSYQCPPIALKNPNFAFSPISQLKCVRYASTNGNIWLTVGSGKSPLEQIPIHFSAVARDKGASRLLALDEWLRKAAVADLPSRLRKGEWLTNHVLQTGHREIYKPSLPNLDMIGAGATEDEATLHALNELAKVRTLSGYASSLKNPLLIVGTNNWVRTQVPFFLIQQYDIYLLFYPNSMPTWVVGVAAFSRLRVEEKPLFAFASHPKIGQAIENALWKALEICRPKEWGETTPPPAPDKKNNASKLNLWWTHWIYRCPKIALKDIIHLEDYSNDLQQWKDYFQDGHSPIGRVSLNHKLLPASLRHIVKVHTQEEWVKQNNVRNINGIGSWASFKDALANQS